MIVTKEKLSQVYTFWSVLTAYLKTNYLSQQVVLPGLYIEHLPPGISVIAKQHH